MPISARIILAAFLMMGLAAGAGLGCQPEQKPVGEKAAKFRDQVVVILVKAKKHLAPVADYGKLTELQKAMRVFYRELKNEEKLLPCRLGVLDANGVVLAGIFPDPEAPGGVKVKTGGQDYSRYDKVRQAINSRGRVQFTLYTSDGTVYMICSPLNDRGNSGAVCLAFFGSELNDHLGVSDEEFASLNFN